MVKNKKSRKIPKKTSCNTPFDKSKSKAVCTFYRVTQKHLLYVFLFVLTITIIVGIFIQKPTVFIVCTMLVLLSGFTLIYNIRILNGFVISTIPMYFALSVYTTINAPLIDYPGVIIHYVNLIIPILVLWFHHKNVSAIAIILGITFFISFLVMGSIYIKGFETDIYYNFILMPEIIIISISGAFVSSIIFWIKNDKRIN